jgi:hypothetical protein
MELGSRDRARSQLVSDFALCGFVKFSDFAVVDLGDDVALRLGGSKAGSVEERERVRERGVIHLHSRRQSFGGENVDGDEDVILELLVAIVVEASQYDATRDKARAEGAVPVQASLLSVRCELTSESVDYLGISRGIVEGSSVGCGDISTENARSES